MEPCSDSDQSPQWLASSELAQWDAFVDACAEGNPYSKSFWLKAFAETVPNASFRILVVRAKDGSIAAGVALCIDKNKARQTRVLHSFSQYSTFLFAPSQTADKDRSTRRKMEMATAIAQTLETAGFESITLSHHPSMPDVRALMWRNWVVSPEYTFLVDLNSLGGLPSFAHAQRNKINKGLRAGLLFRSHNSLEHLEERIVSILAKTFVRQQIDTTRLDPCIGGLEGYRRFLKAIKPEGTIRIYEAVHPDGTTTAMRVGLIGPNNTYYDWLAGNDPQYNSIGASSFLISNILTSLKAEGISRFDFGGANTPTIAAFKQAFNGDLICGFRTYWHSSRIVHRGTRLAGKLSWFLRKKFQAHL